MIAPPHGDDFALFEEERPLSPAELLEHADAWEIQCASRLSSPLPRPLDALCVLTLYIDSEVACVDARRHPDSRVSADLISRARADWYTLTRNPQLAPACELTACSVELEYIAQSRSAPLCLLPLYPRRRRLMLSRGRPERCAG